MGQNVIVRFWWESGLSSASRKVLVGIWIIVCIQKPSQHFLQTFRPLRVFKIVFRNSSLYPKQLYSFCLLWLISANFAKMLGWKTWIWRQIITSQTTHTKYKWRHMPLNKPPHENFLRTPLGQSVVNLDL